MGTYNIECGEEMIDLSESEMLQWVDDAICDNIWIHKLEDFQINPEEYVESCVRGYGVSPMLSADQITTLVQRVQKWAEWRYAGDEK